MKKIVEKILVWLAAIIIVPILNISGFAEAGSRKPENLYPACGQIISIEENLVIVEDLSGNAWTFCGSEDWAIGDIVAMIMDNMNTSTIYDDEIVDIRYCGYLENMN